VWVAPSSSQFKQRLHAQLHNMLFVIADGMTPTKRCRALHRAVVQYCDQ
jgi:hypothetical protein